MDLYATLWRNKCVQHVIWVFSPRVFPRPYPQSPNLPQPKSRAEHTYFTTK